MSIQYCVGDLEEVHFDPTYSSDQRKCLCDMARFKPYHVLLLILFPLALAACTPPASARTTPDQFHATPTPVLTQALADYPPAQAGTAITLPEAEQSPSAESGLITSQLPSAAPTVWPLSDSPPNQLSYRYWRWWPVIPNVSRTMYQIYQSGIDLGVNRHVFSIVGDCQSMPPVFGGRYDHPGQYQLPQELEYLRETIEYFAGSYDRPSVTVQNGFSVTAALSPLWADPEICLPSETPLDCELRSHRPSFVFISLGTNWIPGAASRHNDFLEQIIDQVITSGAVPILVTKGDNLEGDHSINLGIAEIAARRDLPLWNFWRAIQGLPDHGLDVEREGNYLSVAAWDVRSISGLQVLDTLWRQLEPNAVQDSTGQIE